MWKELEEQLGKKAADAVKRLYDYYGTEWTKWMFNLYDPKTGGFYYSNSARDYDEFFTDAESTCQALDMLQELGLFKSVNDDWARALPTEMREACLKHIQNMQDPDDGYFYHPQWGKDTANHHCRLGRDYAQCLSLLNMMGGKPLYKTATERMEETVSNKDENAEKGAAFPEHLKSAEALKAYIDRIFIPNTSHGVGHILSSQAMLIKAAGLAEVCLEHMDTYQSTETGYWGEGKEHEYDKISGIIKLGGLYGVLGGRMKYMDKVIDSAIETVLSKRNPDNICLVFNSVGGLCTAVGHVRRTSDPNANDCTNIDVVMKKVYDKLPEMIDATIEKLDKFRYPDGSYSYLQGKSAPNMQGVIVSKGLAEGDINGTTVAIYYVLNSLFPLIGAKRLPLLTEKNYKEFIETIKAKTAEAKK